MPFVKVVTFGVLLSLTLINIQTPTPNRLPPSALYLSVIKLQINGAGAAVDLMTQKAFVLPERASSAPSSHRGRKQTGN